MRILKLLTLSLLLSGAALKQAAAQPKTETFGIHLYFNEQEFIDVLTLSRDAQGRLTGHMHVPDDFDGAIENIQENGLTVSFDLPVPKNASRPQDLMFHYEGRFFDASRRQMIGFVRLKDQTEFIASFVGFLR